ncbi:hypothetical protein SAMD00019534_094590 [Acytostelium subglobosum LB1]|uniref:hypothetical protein n=1 Tax=Acytostelium subglobosum LB1 TaxID=1410327 RepID=UPI000644C93E|nr:hypothetical protein SAMD00019534_094590 [Acytostelium subglobosum LB1]GAM26284.1 hypothetical protein SAMD00019534_094590 [Acytostelium subglobosum LB1]|eukprot:XP_012750838.1 hypothetical protein SAMD00019534_094590 [Acytostelium subglobosum LB1]
MSSGGGGIFIDPAFDISHIILSSFYLALMISAVAASIYCKGLHSFASLVFYILLIVGCALRAALFIIYILVVEQLATLEDPTADLLGTLPSFFFFTVYSVALILGTKVVDDHLPSTAKFNIKLIMRVIIIGNFIMYFMATVLYILDYVFPHPSGTGSLNTPMTLIGQIIQMLVAVIYVIGSVYFVYTLSIHYLRNWKEFRAATRNNDTELEVIRKMFLAVFGYSSLSFIVRAVMTAVTTFVSITSWSKDIFYYTVLEVLPMMLLLIIMTRRTSLILLYQQMLSLNLFSCLTRKKTEKTPLITKP